MSNSRHYLDEWGSGSVDSAEGVNGAVKRSLLRPSFKSISFEHRPAHRYIGCLVLVARLSTTACVLTKVVE